MDYHYLQNRKVLYAKTISFTERINGTMESFPVYVDKEVCLISEYLVINKGNKKLQSACLSKSELFANILKSPFIHVEYQLYILAL